MKKSMIIIPFLVAAMLLFNSSCIIAQTKVFIPDSNFRNFLNTNYPAFMDGSGDSLLIDSAATLTGTLNCSFQLIADLTGVEYFVNITQLNCQYNQLTALPALTNNTALQVLWCYNNQLTALPDLTNNTALLWLYCEYNQLTALPDLTNNTALLQLRCHFNQLAALPALTNNTALQWLFCNDNQLTALPALTNNTDLLWLYCDNNQLTALPALTNNTALQEINCYNNQLTSLPDLANNNALQQLRCYNNKLDFSDARELRIADTISTLTAYTYSPQNPFDTAGTFNLYLGDTLILSIANQDSALSYQWFRGTDTVVGATDTLLIIPNVTFAVSGAYSCRSYGTALLSPSPMSFAPGISSFVSESIIVGVKDTLPSIKVFIPGTNFRNFLNTNYPTFMDITGDSLLIDSAATITSAFVCAGQNIADITGLEWFFNVQDLYCYNNLLTTLPDLSAFTNLRWLHCYDNQLTSIPDLSASTVIRQLYCYNNQLTALPNLSSPNFTLQRLYCEYNQLTALPDLSSHFALERLYCNDNLLTSLPNLDNTLLERLYCSRNELTTLPSLPDNSLKILGCDQNQITSLADFTGFLALEDIYCYSNQLKSLPDFSTITTLKTFGCRYNKLDFSDARELRIINSLPLITLFMYDMQKPFGDSAAYTFCEGDSVALSIASQDSALSYQWFRGTDTIAGATDTILLIPNIALTDSGIYTCRTYGTALLFPPMLFGPGVSEFVSESITVTVKSKPAVSFASLDDVCINTAAFTLTGGSPTGGTYSGTAVDSANFDPASAGTGIHIITFTYTDTSGCTDTATQPIVVAPTYSISTPDDTICDGDSIMIFGIFCSTTGTYYNSLTTGNGCDSIISTNLIVNSLPIVSFSGLDTGYCTTAPPVTLTGTPPGGTFSGAGISGDQFDPNNAGTGTHIIVYFYTDGNGCTDTVSQNVTITICTGTDGLISEKTIKLFPNPNTGEFIIEMFFLKEVKELEIKITNISGQDLYYEQLKQFTGKYHREINLSDYAKGVYRLQIKTNNTTVNKKIILE